MAGQQAMSLRDRYDEWISEAFEKKDEDIDAVKEQRLEEANRLAKDTKPGPSESVSLPTSSRSSAIFRVSTGTFVAITSVVEITDSQEVADIRISLRNHESEILSLRIQLEGTWMKVQNLHKQCRKASEDYATRSAETMKRISRGLRSEKRSLKSCWSRRIGQLTSFRRKSWREKDVWENSGRSWLRWKKETKQGKLCRLKQRRYTFR